MIILMFVTALVLSGIAAWYSIAGLMAIFAAASIPIAIMGASLEVSKLVVASWLYRNWKEVPKLLKIYFTVALVVLMFLTSMGIFGFLSKAHLDQAVPSGDVESKVELVDDKIEYQKSIIDESREALNQLDSQINRYTELGSVSKGVKVRKNQAEERAEIQTTIQNAQSEIETLNNSKFQIEKQLREIEAEVGPIKYIAALIYGDNPDSNVLEKAVRVVILMIVSVFDPLAVLMLVAANWSLKNNKIQTQEDIDNLYWEQLWNEDTSWVDNIRDGDKKETEEEKPSEEPINPIDREYQEYQDYLKNKKEWDETFYDIENPQTTIEEEVEEIQKVYGLSVNEIDYDPVTKKTYKRK